MDRGIYDIKNEDKFEFKTDKGFAKKQLQLFQRKNEPEWMTEFRLKSLDIYNELSLPTWGPSLDELDMIIQLHMLNKIQMAETWEEVPEDIKRLLIFRNT